MKDRFSIYDAYIGRTFTRLGEDAAVVRPAGAVRNVFFLLAFLFVMLFSSTGWAATPSGTNISNSAKATYTSSVTGNLTTASSNTVSVTTAASRTRAVVEFLNMRRGWRAPRP